MFSRKKLTTTVLLFTTLLMAQLDSPAALAKKSPAKKAAVCKDAAVAKSPAFMKAAQAYQQGKYKEASTQLEYIDTHGGCCQWTHYYLGLCYQGLNQVNLATEHFQWVLSYGTDASLRRYSQYATDTLAYYAANRSYAGNGGVIASASFG